MKLNPKLSHLIGLMGLGFSLSALSTLLSAQATAVPATPEPIIITATSAAPLPTPNVTATPLTLTAQEYLSNGDDAFRKNKFRLAIQEYSNAITLDNRLVAAYVGRARATIEFIGNAEGTTFVSPQQDVIAALALEPQNVLALTLQAYLQCVPEDLQACITAFTALKTQFPNNPLPYNYLGQFYLFNGQTQLALTEFNESLTLDPNQPLTLNSRAVAYAILQQPAIALEDLNLAIGLDPTIALYYINRSRVHGLLGDSEAALADITQAIAVQPDYEQSYVQRAFLYLEAGNQNVGSARQFYTAALNDLNSYITLVDPQDMNPEVASLILQVQNTLTQLP
jgi:tetratricopeptide (TPR) repeat protein